MISNKLQALLVLSAIHWTCSFGGARVHCQERGTSRFEYAGQEMGTSVRIVLYSGDEAAALRASKAAFSRIRDLNSILSAYDPGSELSRLCRDSSVGQEVRLSVDLWRVLARADEISRASGGAFDVTVGPVVRLWRKARQLRRMPDPEELQAARSLVGHRLVQLDPDGRSARLLEQGMQLDLGAIAKGYAAGEALQALRDQGTPCALVEIGGDIAVGSPPPGMPGWRIGIAPRDGKAESMRSLWLSEAAVATSGDAEQFVEIDGQRYSHIVDPRTGLGLTDHGLVTIVARDGMTADALATAASVLDAREGLDLIEMTPGAAGRITRVLGGADVAKESRSWKSLSWVDHSSSREAARADLDAASAGCNAERSSPGAERSSSSTERSGLSTERLNRNTEMSSRSDGGANGSAGSSGVAAETSSGVLASPAPATAFASSHPEVAPGPSEEKGAEPAPVPPPTPAVPPSPPPAPAPAVKPDGAKEDSKSPPAAPGTVLPQGGGSTQAAVPGKKPFDPTVICPVAWMLQPVPLPEATSETAEGMKPYTEHIPGSDAAFDMVPIPGGKFLMGSPPGEPNRGADEGPQIDVELEPFWMGKREVAWKEYELWGLGYDALREKPPGQALDPHDALADAITRPTKPYADMSFGMGKDGCPAISMTHLAAKVYCKWLSAKTGRYYRLPTEAEWEYACRAGTKTAYSFGDDPKDLKDHVWFFDDSDDKYHEVGRKKPNPWGLFDMHGNVAEWVVDQYTPEGYGRWEGKPQRNPMVVPETIYPRVARGGSWMDDPPALRSAARRGSSPDWMMGDPQIPKSIWYHTDARFVGFRVVRPLRVPSQEEAALYDLDPAQKQALADYLEFLAGKQ